MGNVAHVFDVFYNAPGPLPVKIFLFAAFVLVALLYLVFGIPLVYGCGRDIIRFMFHVPQVLVQKDDEPAAAPPAASDGITLSAEEVVVVKNFLEYCCLKCEEGFWKTFSSDDLDLVGGVILRMNGVTKEDVAKI